MITSSPTDQEAPEWFPALLLHCSLVEDFTKTVQHINTLFLGIFSYLQSHIILPKWYKIKNGPSLSSTRSKMGPKCRKCKYLAIVHTCIHSGLLKYMYILDVSVFVCFVLVLSCVVFGEGPWILLTTGWEIPPIISVLICYIETSSATEHWLVIP